MIGKQTHTEAIYCPTRRLSGKCPATPRDRQRRGLPAVSLTAFVHANPTRMSSRVSHTRQGEAFEVENRPPGSWLRKPGVGRAGRQVGHFRRSQGRHLECQGGGHRRLRRGPRFLFSRPVADWTRPVHIVGGDLLHSPSERSSRLKAAVTAPCSRACDPEPSHVDPQN